MSVVNERLKREGKDSPNTKYRSRSALLQERASKLFSGGGELTTRVEPAMIGCERDTSSTLPPSDSICVNPKTTLKSSGAATSL